MSVSEVSRGRQFLAELPLLLLHVLVGRLSHPLVLDLLDRLVLGLALLTLLDGNLLLDRVLLLFLGLCLDLLSYLFQLERRIDLVALVTHDLGHKIGLRALTIVFAACLHLTGQSGHQCRAGHHAQGKTSHQTLPFTSKNTKLINLRLLTKSTQIIYTFITKCLFILYHSFRALFHL